MNDLQMKRYAAFLRGVSPMNVKMPELKLALEIAGFTDVKTLLSSGNVMFTTSIRSESILARKVEEAITRHLGNPFFILIRPVKYLQKMITANPFAPFNLPEGAKPVVTFLDRRRSSKPVLPIEFYDDRILAFNGCEVFSYYFPGPKGTQFMSLIEKTFGRNVTTRTWETVRKCAVG